MIQIILLSLIITCCKNESASRVDLNTFKKSIASKDSLKSSNQQTVSVQPTQDTQRKEPLNNCVNRKDITVPATYDSLIKAQFPNYRIASNSDFADGYWCFFYKEDESPYYTTGDFDGDKLNEVVLIITKEYREETLIVLIDSTAGKLRTNLIERFHTRPNVDPRYTKFTYGLETKEPLKFSPINSDTTYNIQTQIIVVKGFEEKADNLYYYDHGTYKRLMIGC